MCAGDPVGAERELRAAIDLAPPRAADALAPTFNLALLLLRAGARRDACTLWLMYRGHELNAESDDYRRALAALGPPIGVPPPEAHVSGGVSDGACAALDRLALGYFAEEREEADFRARWPEQRVDVPERRAAPQPLV